MVRCTLLLATGCANVFSVPDAEPEPAPEVPVTSSDTTTPPIPPVEATVVDSASDTGTVPAHDALVRADGTGDFLDIQAAIDASSPGDVILVGPGTYGPIEVLWSYDVVVTSIGGPSITTIDGGTDHAVYVRDGALELSGFTVTGTGQTVPWATEHGGAFTIQEGVVTIRDCVVEGVTGPFALVFDEDLLVLDNVTWRNNTTGMLWFLWQGDDAIIERNVVTGGVHEHVVMAERLDQLHLRNTAFYDITIDTARTAFDLAVTGTGPMVLENNVFYDIDDLDRWGGRLFDGTLEFRNNIVQGCDSGDLRPFDASYSVFWDNFGAYDTAVSGVGNLYVDPMMADPANGSFQLMTGSPAIDAGDPSQVYDDADGTRNDIGVYGGP